MDTALWNKVVSFNIDGPVSEYNFSARLENENYWTINFAAAAILEYKKFMYLAAVSDAMVSPSEIVDVVWHQHLVYTRPYDEFCEVLGKKIAHIPSTHHKDEFSKFRSASDRTKRLYTENFGEQPAEIWDCTTMYDPLKMEKATFNTVKVAGLGAVLFIPVFIAAFFCLYPLYITIPNPNFVLGYILIMIIAFAGLSFYNISKLGAIIAGWQKNVFAFNLTALELVYLQKNSIEPVVHGVVNQLIQSGVVLIESDNTLSVAQGAVVTNPVSYSVIQAIAAEPGLAYHKLVSILKSKPAFNKTARAMDAFKKYISRSKQFIRLFTLNFGITAVVLLIGSVRLVTGLVREKPVTIITGAVVLCLILMLVNLYWLTIAIGTVALPKFYNKNIVYETKEYEDWDWQYFILGNAVFTASFLPLTNYNNDSTYNSGDSSSSCGSGCGGSSCGGCGGD